MMIRTLSLLLFSLLALPSFAQDGLGTYPVTALDSIERDRDSVLTSAYLALSHDSTLVEEHQKIINIYKARKQLDRQITAANRVIALCPAKALAWFLYGDTQLDNSEPGLAEDALKRALVIDPSFVRARVTLAETYGILHHNDSAIWQLDSALYYNPRHAMAHLQRAELLTQQGEDSLVVEDLRIASELLPDKFEPWFKLGRALAKIGHHDEAIDVLRYAITLNDGSPDALLLFAQSNAIAGRTQMAIESYQQFMFRFPRDPRALDVERAARDLGWKP